MHPTKGTCDLMCTPFTSFSHRLVYKQEMSTQAYLSALLAVGSISGCCKMLD